MDGDWDEVSLEYILLGDQTLVALDEPSTMMFSWRAQRVERTLLYRSLGLVRTI